MRNIHRHIHFDFHTMPGITNFGEHWDAEAFAQRLADAHVDYINFFAQCNLGFAYFPTKVGIPYPGLRGDMLGDALAACHRHGIGMTAYINIGLMHEQASRHPEWCRMDKDGAILRGDRVHNNFFRTMCYNAPGYHDYVLALIREICSYDIDGLFCDCMHFFPCHCAQCTRDMLALGIDLTDEEAVEAFSRDVMMRISREIKSIVGPDRYVYFNGMPYYAYRDLDTHIEIECLPSGGWGYDYLWSHAAYARSITRTLLYMTGRFQASWGDFGGYKGKISIESDLYDGLCNNMMPSVGDHLHPAEIEERDIYRDIGEIYEKLSLYEPYTKGACFVHDIGVLTDSDGPLGTVYAGLARMLLELKQPFNVLHRDMDFSGCKLLILPNEMTVDTALAARLKAFLEGGGRLLSVGAGGLTTDRTSFALEAYDATLLGVDTNADGYFTFTQTPADCADMRWATYSGGIRMRAHCAKDVRAEAVSPYFPKHWDGIHGYFYTPPAQKTGDTAAAVFGNVAHISFDVFGA
ncbi:MAG: hypothetical protein RR482_06915, partial [Clostridia bacterium]